MRKNEIHLSDHMTYKKLLKFTFPSIMMMVFTSIYGIVDGLFLSNFAGKTAFAAINLVMPVVMVISGLGFMMGTGGCALVAKTLGEKKNKEASEIFSSVIYFTIIMALVLGVIMVPLMKPISIALGATEEMLPHCVIYSRILLGGVVFFMLQNVFQNFYMTAEKPSYGFWTSIASGVFNMILDGLLVGVFKLGVVGAAVATVSAEVVGAFIPFIYFKFNKNSIIRLVKAKIILRNIIKVIFNGCSELLSNISSSIVGIIYNLQLLKYMGEDGVAAYGVLMYVNFIFIAVFIGYAIGSAGFIGYNYGAENSEELKNIKRRSYNINIVFGIVMCLTSFFLARILASIFVGYDENLLNITVSGLRVYSFAFIIIGCNIFTSSFFTALNNGLISGIISILRTLVFQTSSVIILPLILGKDGIWGAVIIAEVMALIIGLVFLFSNQKKYKY